MKKLIIIPLLFLTVCAFSQVRWGLRLGLSTSQLEADDFNILNGTEEFKLALKDASYGIHGGLVLQVELGNVLLQPEVIFNSNSADLELEDLGTNTTEVATKEKYQYLDIPVMLGYRLGFLRLHAGPVGHIFLNSTSGLTDVEGFEEDFDSLTLGWQGGLGIDIGPLALDLRYEGNFNKFGDHITFGGQQYAFNQNPARFLAAVSYMFGDR